MIWITWRQQRPETLMALGLLALMAVFLLKTGIDMASGYQRLGVAACLAHDPAPGGCQIVTDTFQIRFSSPAKIILWPC